MQTVLPAPTASCPSPAPNRYRFADLRRTSERIGWRVEDLIGGSKQLDFSRPFLPESLAGTQALSFLDSRERLLLNQIRGYGYLRMFVVVEAFIMPFVLDHTRGRLDVDDEELRTLLGFLGEEAKHTHLFNCFREQFEAGFGSPCGFIGPQEEIVAAVMAHPPLGVALAILMVEWLTQDHYVESVKDAGAIDPLFASMLRHHWMEEAQHAKIDAMITEAMAREATPAEVEAGLDAFFAIGAFVDAGLQQQVQLDLESLERACGRCFSAAERETFLAEQLRSQRRTFLGGGMTNARFHETLAVLHPDASARVRAAAPLFS